MPAEALENRIDLSTANGLAELEAHVLCRLGSRIRDFWLARGDRGLILGGRALTYHAKQLAQHAVMDATDYPIQANDIAVS